MKKIVKKVIAPIVMFLAPVMAFAQTGQVQQGMWSLRSLFPLTGIAGSQTIPQLIANIIKILLFIAGALAILFIIIGGYQYLTSAGNEEQAEKGRKTLINAVIGIVVVILSYVIINVVVNTVSGFGWF